MVAPSPFPRQSIPTRHAKPATRGTRQTGLPNGGRRSAQFGEGNVFRVHASQKEYCYTND